ncbi:MAG: glycosyltransferase family 9 protein [Chloroflexota bacterium]|nr:MAG: glycosyltransferase family 9 protein [Chloroflexota bacterium]
MAVGRDEVVGLACRLLGRAFPSAPLPLSELQAARRVLVLKPCCLGDVLLSTAALAALRSALPDAWLAYAVGDWARAALTGNPHLDAILPCKVRGGERPRLADYRDTVATLRRERFDVCFVLDRSPLITVLPVLAGISHRIGIDSGGRGFSLTVRVPWAEQKHEAELYLDTVRAVGIGTTGFGMEFYPSADDLSWARARLGALDRLRVGTVPRVAIHPGGGVNPGMTLLAKRWPAERYVAFVLRLLEKGRQVVLIGGSSDAEVVREVETGIGAAATSDGLLTVLGETSLGQLAALISSCDLFVGNDTGPMHLAAAVGTPVVAIFGPSTPAMYGPYSPRARSIYRQVHCSPCFVKGRFARDCQDYICMQAVDVDHVWETAVDLVPAVGR